MRTATRSSIIFALVFMIAGVETWAQRRLPISVCRPQDYVAFQPLPKLAYECPEDLSDSDDKLLKLPARRAAIKQLLQQLQKLNEPRWWQADVAALNVCDFRGSAGVLSAEEKKQMNEGDYLFQLFGNHQLRVVLVSDPCYQAGYNGSILFLLNRNNGRLAVSPLFDGYYSRVENSVGVGFAQVHGDTIVELETANSMPPTLINYYFRIDRHSGNAEPYNIFRDGQKSTNQIYSAMLFGTPADFGLPQNARELSVISSNRLARQFSAYREDEQGKLDDNGRKLRRVIYRWQGSYYVASN